MSQTKLDIELERQPARFRPGEPIRGFVRARSEQPLPCERLTVACAWIVTTPVRERPYHQSYGAGSLELAPVPHAQTEHQLPFEISAPPGPFSFEGDQLQTTWTLSAIQGFRMMPSSYARTRFELTPWMPGEMLGCNADYRAAPVAPPDGYEYGLPSKARRYLTASPHLSLPAHTRNVWSRLKTGPLHVECPSVVAAGERLVVRVHFPKGPRARIAGVEVRLSAFESFDDRVTTPVGLFWKPVQRTAALQIADAVPDPGFADSATDAWTAAFDIPLDAPPSMHTAGPALCWRIEVRCRSKSTPERLVVKPLLLQPPRLGGARAAA